MQSERLKPENDSIHCMVYQPIPSYEGYCVYYLCIYSFTLDLNLHALKLIGAVTTVAMLNNTSLLQFTESSWRMSQF